MKFSVSCERVEISALLRFYPFPHARPVNQIKISLAPLQEFQDAPLNGNSINMTFPRCGPLVRTFSTGNGLAELRFRRPLRFQATRMAGAHIALQISKRRPWMSSAKTLGRPFPLFEWKPITSLGFNPLSLLSIFIPSKNNNKKQENPSVTWFFIFFIFYFFYFFYLFFIIIYLLLFFLIGCCNINCKIWRKFFSGRFRVKIRTYTEFHTKIVSIFLLLLFSFNGRYFASEFRNKLLRVLVNSATKFYDFF